MYFGLVYVTYTLNNQGWYLLLTRPIKITQENKLIRKCMSIHVAMHYNQFTYILHSLEATLTQRMWMYLHAAYISHEWSGSIRVPYAMLNSKRSWSLGIGSTARNILYRWIQSVAVAFSNTDQIGIDLKLLLRQFVHWAFLKSLIWFELLWHSLNERTARCEYEVIHAHSVYSSRLPGL